MPRDSMDFDLPDSASTETLGMAMARSLPGPAPGMDTVHAGAVLYLQGDLGSGKTTCARSLIRTMGVAGPVRSPTYTLVETYATPRLICVHVDLYRLQSLREIDELGLRDLPNCLLLVEWPEKGRLALPRADLDLTLSYVGESRHARLDALTPLGSSWMDNLAHDTSLRSYVANLT